MVPKGWRIRELQELASIERGRFSPRPRNDPQYYGGIMPFVQTGDIANAKTYLTKYRQTINEKGVAVSKVFPANSILLTIAANIGETAITTFNVACPDSLVGIKPHIEKSDVFWLKMVLETKQQDLDSKSTQNAQKNINLDTLKPLLILTPPLAEQKKIAQILTTWHKAISTTEKLLKTSQKQKQALMQQLLTGKKRVPEFSAEWEKAELGELLDYKQPTEFIVNSNEYSELSTQYPVPVLTAGKSFILGYTKEQIGIYEKNLPAIIFDDFTTASKYVGFPFKVKSSAIKILTAKSGVSIKYVYETMQLIKYQIGGHQRH
ncbi:MAG: restriction endonuclease subunit S, partial [Methylotenera sp.]|nr:restriction endonuclease subunit S [Methylotenera sp.]